jgi:hypothetical protein
MTTARVGVVELPLDLGKRRGRDLGHVAFVLARDEDPLRSRLDRELHSSGSPFTLRSIPWTLISPRTTVCSRTGFSRSAETIETKNATAVSFPSLVWFKLS